MESWESSVFLHSGSHYDDHLAFKFLDEDGRYGVAVISDGVSSCDGGRIAAVVACESIVDFISKNHTGRARRREFELIDAAMEYAGKSLLDVGNKIVREGIDGITAILQQIEPEDHRTAFVETNRDKILAKIKVGKTPAFECTAIVIYFRGPELYLGMVGDGELLEVREGALFPYLQSKGKLVTYLSSETGFQGPARKLHVELAPDSVFIIASDGGLLSYKGQSGSPYGLLQSVLRKAIEVGDFARFGQMWYQALRAEEKKRGIEIIADDLSLIAVKFLRSQLERRASTIATEGGVSLKDVLSKSMESIESIYEELGDTIAERVHQELVTRTREALERHKAEMLTELPAAITSTIQSRAEMIARQSMTAMADSIKTETTSFSDRVSKEVFDKAAHRSSPILEAVHEETRRAIGPILEQIEKHARDSVAAAFKTQALSLTNSVRAPVQTAIEDVLKERTSEFQRKLPSLLLSIANRETIASEVNGRLSALAEDLLLQLKGIVHEEIEAALDKNKASAQRAIVNVREVLKQEAGRVFAGMIEELSSKLTVEMEKQIRRLGKEMRTDALEEVQRAAKQAIVMHLDKAADSIK